jgi:Mrp family chromosome partitioning ATPase
MAVSKPRLSGRLGLRESDSLPIPPMSGPLSSIPEPMLEACRAASRLMGGPSIRCLGVTSALRGEGRTSVAQAMAVVQRHDFGRRVVLVEMDFENPSLAKAHNLKPWPGLAELSRVEAPVTQVLQRLRNGVQVVTLGAIDTSPSRMATEVAESKALATLENEADVVIADLPPMLPSGLGFAAARQFQNLLFVVRAGVTPIARVREATADLHVTPHILLNGTQSSLPRWLIRLLGR